MFWLKLKTALVDIWGFIKRNWEWIAGIVGVIVTGIILSAKARSLKEIAKTFSVLNMKRRKDYKKAVDSHQKEIKKRRKVIEKYDKAVKDIEERYNEKEEDLKKQKKKEVKEIAKENEADPDKFAKEIADKYNLDYVE